ncbi:MAG: 3-hydroxyacyl-CoA dehydrogenase NAD-binding domain-containing protein, partial [Myxococcota bacterium]
DRHPEPDHQWLPRPVCRAPDAGARYVRGVLDKDRKKRRLSAYELDRTMSFVTATTEWSGVGAADVVIEAVFEELELKREMLRAVEQHGHHEVIFASNTSSIPIANIAEAASHPERVIGMHYFSPVEKMPLLEIVTTEKTADWVTATCVALGKAQGKTVIVVRDGAGFYTSRILAPYMNEAAWLFAEGVSLEAIDEAMTSFGFPVGPITLMDEVGIDVGAKVGAIMQGAFGERMRAPEVMETVVTDGRHGRKSGRGFYRYSDGVRDGIDRSIYELLPRAERVEVSVEEIQDRMILQMVNEAARCLDEGILRNARDGDIGAVFGLGFPPFLGGPFSYIDRRGAASVCDRLSQLRERYGVRFEVAPNLEQLAKSGAAFR